MEFKFDIDTSAHMRELKDLALNLFKEASLKNIKKHFGATSYYSQTQKKNVTVEGPGTLQINKTLEEFFDDPKTTAQMDKFFNENFERIMEQTMTNALQHNCNRLMFSRVRNKAKEEQK